MRKIIISIFIFSFFSFFLFAQDKERIFSSDFFISETDVSPDKLHNRVLLANSTSDYPVTPGDIYKLLYTGPQGLISFDIIIPSNYQVNLNLFGSINVMNMTFLQLSQDVLAIIRAAYSESNPQLILQSIGMFQIYIVGEVIKTNRIACWGLTRLSDVIQNNIIDSTSIRDIEIISADDTKNEYDLFQFIRFGIKQQNPYVRPADTIFLKRIKRQINISGEVFRPGKYQLLDNENLIDLLSLYADGMLFNGLPAEIQIKRLNTKTDEIAEMYYIDADSPIFENFILHNGDSVFVPGKERKLPVVYFEGAINIDETMNKNIQENGTGKYVFHFAQGEMLSSALNDVQDMFSYQSDLHNAYIYRRNNENPIIVNMEELLFNYSPNIDIKLERYDRIIIPFRQYFVTISGAVRSPGKYPYVPNRDYMYYVYLAGGIDPEKNSGNLVRITDIHENKKDMNINIQAEDNIFVMYNNPLYHINRWSSIIGTAISLTTLVISIVQIFN